MIGPILLLMGLWLAQRAATGHGSRAIVGAVPKGAGSMAMTAALGPAALLTTPQGKAAVAKGLVLAQSARKGNPRSKAKVAKIKRDARRGDPKAKQAATVLATAEAVRSQAEDELEDDEAELDQGDEG